MIFHQKKGALLISRIGRPSGPCEGGNWSAVEEGTRIREKSQKLLLLLLILVPEGDDGRESLEVYWVQFAGRNLFLECDSALLQLDYCLHYIRCYSSFALGT